MISDLVNVGKKWHKIIFEKRIKIQKKIKLSILPISRLYNCQIWKKIKLEQAMAEQGPTRVPIPTMCNSNITSIYLISF